MYKGKRTDQTVRTMSDVEAAWVGAMIEGEGSIRLRGRLKPGVWVPIGAHTRDRLDDVDQISPMGVDFYSTDVETIATMLRLTGCGTVYYREPRPDYVSPNGAQAFAKKPSWQWVVQYKELVRGICAQIQPYLTSKRDLAMLAYMSPIAGGSCHPSHFEAPAPADMSEEEIERNWADYNRQKKSGIDPRAIDKHFKFKEGHEPGYLEEESGWKYLNIEFEGEEADPDQRDLLKDSTPVAMDCERCGTQLRAVGSMSSWDVMNQPRVSLVNRDDIDKTRQKELEEEKVVILACPNCRQKYQWLEEFLPKELP
ncbi:hypothetical protein LCGC14_0288930 [marine sediment metagenome]|uniref:Uncharacterized protein n=1 Tax=marine sediment metagenome TaxID=412755 RepID=A0A0F9WEY4_9ZZZZ